MAIKQAPIGISIKGKEMHTLADAIKSHFPEMGDEDHFYIICDPGASIHDLLEAGHQVGYQTFRRDPGLLIPFVSTGSFGNFRKKP